MEPKFVNLTNKGMQQDNSISKTQNDFAFENVNIRITADKDGTQLSVTNEAIPVDVDTYIEHGKVIYKHYINVSTRKENVDDTYSWFVDFSSPVLFESQISPLPPYKYTTIRFEATYAFKFPVISGENNQVPIRSEVESNILSPYFPSAYVDYDVLFSVGDTTVNLNELVNALLVQNPEIVVPSGATVEIISLTIVGFLDSGGVELSNVYKDGKSGSFLYFGDIVPDISEEIIPIQPTTHITEGKCIKTQRCGNYIIIFTADVEVPDRPERIYRLRYEDGKIYTRLLYESINLGLHEYINGEFKFYNVDTCYYYESEDIQKLYWVSENTQPRLINIVDEREYIPDNETNFYPLTVAQPTINTIKNYNYSGIFAAGVIQYFVTYYYKFGAETPIIQATDLNYLSFKNRGGKADENVYCGIHINIDNVDTQFQYLRIYSAQRTSIDSKPIVKIVADLEINEKSSLSYIDLGEGETVDSSLLNFVGGQRFIAKTLEIKDETLFAGNIKVSKTFITDKIVNCINTYGKIQNEDGIYESSLIEFTTKDIEAAKPEGYYAYSLQINKSQKDFSTFKYGEIYRFALQFKTATGEWTAPIWIGDKKCDIRPTVVSDDENSKYVVAGVICNLMDFFIPHCDSSNPEYISGLREELEAYFAARLLIAQTNVSTRQTLAQGIVSGTLFNYQERFLNEPYSIPSWNFRIRNGNMPYRQYESIGCHWKDYAELQGLDCEKVPAYSVAAKDRYEHIKYFTLLLGLDPGHEAIAIMIYFSLPEDNSEQSKVNIRKLLDKDSTDYKFQVYSYNDSVSNRNSSFWQTNSYYKAIVTDNINTTKWDKTINQIYDQLEDENATVCSTLYEDPDTKLIVAKSALPNKNECKKILSTKHGTEIAKAIASGLIAAAAVVASVFSFGAAAAPAAALTAMAIGAMWIGTACLSIAIVGTAAMTSAVVKATRDMKLDKADKLMLKKGWLYAGKSKDIQELFEKKFENSSTIVEKIKNAFSGGSYWCTGGTLHGIQDYVETDADTKSNQFYVDNSIVTVNSPDFDSIKDIADDNPSLGFRIVGYIPIQANYMGYNLTVGQGFNSFSKVTRNYTENQTLGSSVHEEFTNGDIFYDGSFANIDDTDSVIKDDERPSYDDYRVFMWHSKYASMAGDHTRQTISPLTGTSDYGVIEHKLYANQLFSYDTVYLSNPWIPESDINNIRLYHGDSNVLDLLTDDFDLTLYKGGYDTVITTSKKYPAIVPKYFSTDPEDWYEGDVGYGHENMKMTNPVRIQFESSPHIIVPFKTDWPFIETLPRLVNTSESNADEEKPTSLIDLYTEEVTNHFIQPALVKTDKYTIPWNKQAQYFSDISDDIVLYLTGSDEPLNFNFSDSDYDNINVRTIDISYDEYNGSEVQTVTKQHYRFEVTPNNTSIYNFVKNVIETAFSTDYSSILTHPNYSPDGNKTVLDEACEAFLWQGLYTLVVKANVKYPDTDEIVSRMCLFTIDSVTSAGGDYWMFTFDFYNDDFNAIVGKTFKTIKPQGYNYDHYTSSVVNPPGCITSDPSRQVRYPLNYYVSFDIAENTNSRQYVFIFGVNILTARILIAGANFINRYYTIVDNDNSKLLLQEFGVVLKEDTITIDDNASIPQGYLYIGEIYKRTFDYSTLYGGYSDEALQRLSWNVASDAVKLSFDISEDGNYVNIKNVWGDSYFQRWDCLKTYPLHEGDENSIVEICSCMLESYTNLDGRCDVNRGISNIKSARPSNWNLMNPVYSQTDNLFQYNILDSKFKLDQFKNQIWWSTTKLPAATIDNWTSMNSLSSLMVDGQYGEIRKLKRFNNTLIFFQDRAIGVVNYNNRIQISTEQGQPLEVINSGKVNGYSYYDTKSGSLNLNTIVDTKLGVTYVDNFNGTLMLFNGQGSINLGLSYGMSVWLKDKILLGTPDYTQFCDYDTINGDIYIHTDEANPVLVFNESIKSFVEFFDTPTCNIATNKIGGNYARSRMFQMDEALFGIQYNSNDKRSYICKLKSGSEYYPYSITYQVNPNPLTDKLFTNIEFVADFYDDTLGLDNFFEGDPFKTIRVWNEYQDTDNESIKNVSEPAFLSPDKNRKFRIRRLQIPRAMKIVNGQPVETSFRMDRIRNPWCYIKLSSNDVGDASLINKRMTFHNITVKYFE